jgi:hypothetical protein
VFTTSFVPVNPRAKPLDRYGEEFERGLVDGVGMCPEAAMRRAVDDHVVDLDVGAVLAADLDEWHAPLLTPGS